MSISGAIRLLCLVAGLSATSALAASELTIPVDESFDAGKVDFDGEFGVSYRFLWNVVA